jgi:hypothetical protein
MKQIVLFLGAFLILQYSANAAENNPVAKGYTMEISIIPSNSYLEGRVVVDLSGYKGGDIIYYLHGEMWTDSVMFHGQRLSLKQSKVFYDSDYSLIANRAVVKPNDEFKTLSGEDLTLEIYYSGYFHPSMSRSPSDYMRITGDGAFLRAFGYSLWFPVFLEANGESYKPDFKKIVVTTPSNFSTILSGKMESEVIEGDKKVTTWKPGMFDLIDMQLTSAPYARISRDNVFVYYMDTPESKAASESVLDFGIMLTNFYENNIRKMSPGNPLYIMELPKFGDISSGNVTGIQKKRWDNFHNELGTKVTLAHELVHQYVHVPVRWSDPMIAIVIEGFPNYYDILAARELMDSTYYSKLLKRLEVNYISARETGLNAMWHNKVPEEKPLTEITFDEIGAYKDNFVLNDRIVLFMNYLLVNMGEKQFLRFTKEFFGNGEVTYEGFKSLINKYMPGKENEVKVWLETTDFPERFRLENLKLLVSK